MTLFDGMQIQFVTHDDLKERIQNKDRMAILDIRDGSEYEDGHIPYSKSIPLAVIPHALDNIKNVDGDIIVVCDSGVRSLAAAKFLNSRGISAFVLKDGYNKWDIDQKADNGRT